MTERVFIRPAPGKPVRNPRSKQLLPAEGAEVTWSGYWQRRLASKEIVKAKAPKTDNKTAKE